jgi:hypothetical protein
MTYGKETLPIQLDYRRARPNRLEIPLRLRLFLFFLTVVMITFGVFLASLIH